MIWQFTFHFLFAWRRSQLIIRRPTAQPGWDFPSMLERLRYGNDIENGAAREKQDALLASAEWQWPILASPFAYRKL
jgi:hypothetical protein